MTPNSATGRHRATVELGTTSLSLSLALSLSLSYTSSLPLVTREQQLIWSSTILYHISDVLQSVLETLITKCHLTSWEKQHLWSSDGIVTTQQPLPGPTRANR